MGKVTTQYSCRCHVKNWENGNVGSVHDQRVFRLSEVASYLNDATKFPNDCHLLGDAAYFIHENLLMPYRDNGHLSERQKNFNFRHASARIAIERAFGLLKGRFRSLCTLLDMERFDVIPEFILACINYDIPLAPAGNHNHVEGANVAANRRGVIKRDYIAEQLQLQIK
ncbi:uncharacterized protein LOC124405876 [Diprion similis]|uniref:uncharacterized protein LOC124405876 n=1 Tax=Diprion similis TaxID=362088 RepID=UPI001EF7AD9E|nr:uncharacterized protein LOC124405876 [Diprion similis]